ncbi:MAG TPA: hypothetical protein DDW49_10195 [Deltaproteobacteria bacterium]|nr:MAG: hypothetical protein A2048_08220 [Deltaproteobacteria bacterium GWA2_45_12]HBF13732.1 hypothetical protein [Deltaproteobacteria bacterium]
MKKPFPKFKSQKAFDKFLETTDLGDYLEPSDFKKVTFKFRNQDRVISLRISSSLLELLKKATAKHNTKYQRLIKSILEEHVVSYL